MIILRKYVYLIIMEKLVKILEKIDGRGYKAYKEIKGSYRLDDFSLFIDHVQGDPFASPSKLRVRIPQSSAGFDPFLFSNKSRKTALQDYICRQFNSSIQKYSKGIRGTGKSGLIHIDSGRQEILERTSMEVNEGFVEARFYAGLPARGRRVQGKQCISMVSEEIPEIAFSSMLFSSLDQQDLIRFINTSEDQDYLRGQLAGRKLAAFIANGSILPRRSGVSDLPLSRHEAVEFISPPGLEVSLDTLHSGTIKGMGIPEGITIIIGGGFHGKSTLLSAIERGIYNHIPQDGRDYSVSIDSCVKIRAEEGRSVQKVNISPFISNLPLKKDTHKFSTSNASGSTSQAANIIEALECRSGLLLLDEDTSATNFLIRDSVMQKIVPREKEPITPFIDQVKNIYDELGTSSILVMGGSGDYFDVADTVIMMDSYRPVLVTGEAKDAIGAVRDKRVRESGRSLGIITERCPLPQSIDPYRGRKVRVKSRGLDHIQFGSLDIDLSAVEQVVDPSQLNTISDMILYALKMDYINGDNTIMEILDLVFEDISTKSLCILSGYGGHPGSYAFARKFEAAAAINRLRSLKVKQKD